MGPEVDLWAHAMREPLTSIRGFTQLALRRLERQALPESEFVETLKTLERETYRLARIIDDFVDSATFPDETSLDLVPWLHERIREAQLLEPTRGFDVRTPVWLHIRVDGALLGRALVNLLQDAMRYSPSGTPITVTLEHAEPGFLITIQGNGPGGSGTETGGRAVLWRRDSRPGYGLGLHVADRIMERLGGSLTLENRPGGGTRSLIRVPAR